VDDGDHPVVNHDRNAHDMDWRGERGDHACRLVVDSEAVQGLDPLYGAHEGSAQSHRTAQPRDAINRDPDPHEASARGEQALRAGATWCAGRGHDRLVSLHGAHRDGDTQANESPHDLPDRLLRAGDARQAVPEVREDGQLLAGCWYAHR
jgi:hypothetical protein